MEFHKFEPIENFSTLKDESKQQLLSSSGVNWVVTEKVDGCNFHLAISNNGEVKIATRNHYITSMENFYDIQNMVNERLCPLVEFLKTFRKNIRLYGEYFGNGILNRIHYGPKRFVLFQLVVEEKIFSWSEMKDFLGEFSSLMVREVHSSKNFSDCVKFCNENKERLNSFYAKDDHLEGFVITSDSNFPIRVKIKGDKFLETKPFKIQTLSDDDLNIHNSFLSYCTKERMVNVLSYYGEFQKDKIGEIISEFIRDAFKDFSKENSDLVERMDPKIRKKVTSVGGLGFKLLSEITKK